MALYEIPENIVKNIIAVIDNTTIKASEAETVLQMKAALSTPAKAPTAPAPEKK